MKPPLFVVFLLLFSAGILPARDEAAPGAPDGFGALPDETVLVPSLHGIICVADERDLAVPLSPGFAGLDTTRAPLVNGEEWHQILRMFLGQPASLPSLERIPIALRAGLRALGRPFVVGYVPPQELSGGVVRVVIHPARLDGELKIEGARWFSEDSYRAAVPLAPGAEIDAAAVQAGVDRLNRSPHRRVVVVAEPGSQAGTTRLVLRTQETKPWQVTAGYNNAGTAVTDENRVTAGWSWGDAFGRGDTLGYNFSADPVLDHSISHSANYGTTFASGRSLTVFGSYSTIESALPPPLTQEGTSWQAGARFSLPLAKSAGGWERNLSFAADFKYSDNTLEFATIPITDNVTHVAQLGASFSVSRRGESRSLGLTASLYASPGGLTDRNDDAAFAASRAGAKAAYLYGKFDVRFAQRLPRGFSWSTTASLQLASGALLGTEQLNGGGSAGVRGYGESSAFGDEGAMLLNELHLPAFSPFKRKDQADLFAFLDGAALGTRGPGGDTTELASVGVGLNYGLGRHVSLRAAYGWQLKELPNIAGGSSHGHIAATLSY